jgi:hypothetical protein
MKFLLEPLNPIILDPFCHWRIIFPSQDRILQIDVRGEAGRELEEVIEGEEKHHQ